MRKFAVIDIGSNSVRLMFVADGNVLYKTLNTTQLGEGLAHSPNLKEEAIERTAQAVAAFFIKAKSEGAEQTFVFATAAVRSAANRQQFLDRVNTLCALSVEVLSGVEEAETGIAGALGNADGGIIDVGGASTEVIVREKGRIVYEKSVDIGVVRLRDLCGREEKCLTQRCVASVESFGEVPKTSKTYAIGGTATTLAALQLGLKEYSSALVTGLCLKRSDVERLAKELLATPVAEIAKHPCIPQKRAEVIAGGAVLFCALMDKLGLEEIFVSDSDNLEGFAKLRGLL